MNSFEPSAVVAFFRATSRKLLRPKLIFSALMVTNSTSPRFPRVSSSMAGPLLGAFPAATGTGLAPRAVRDIKVPYGAYPPYDSLIPPPGPSRPPHVPLHPRPGPRGPRRQGRRREPRLGARGGRLP